MPLVGELAQVADRLDGDRVVDFGIRPESVRLGESVGSADGTAEATIVGSQYLGAEHLVELDVGGPRLLCRIEGDGEFETGQSCRVGIELEAAHLFHPETGARL
jgi:ABC-type sugar transport system ATPase subunit